MTGSRPDPDAILAKIKREERESARGRLRVYLGAFPGVGKTYTMLSEAHRRKSYGEDVVVGYVETHGRKAVADLLEGLEVVPRKQTEYRGVVLGEMDVEAILDRHPAVCLVDELAHTNVAGSDREKRYEDVETLLSADIDVVTTLNIQHLESLNDTIETMTGVKVRETIPDYVLDQADEVILIDLSPEGARARMEHGHIYPPEQAKAALQNFYQAENLAALREMALRRTADEVDEQLDEYMRESTRKADLDERILVLVDERIASRALIRQAWREAQGLRAELLVTYVKKDRTDAQERELAKTLELAEDLNGRIYPIEVEDLAKGLASLIQAEGVNHLVLSERPRSLFGRIFSKSLAEELLSQVSSLVVHLVAYRHSA